MLSSSKALLLTAASVSLGMAGAAAADSDGHGAERDGNPYVAGDMHNHNTCTDGSVSAGYAIDRAVGTGTAAAIPSDTDAAVSRSALEDESIEQSPRKMTMDCLNSLPEALAYTCCAGGP